MFSSFLYLAVSINRVTYSSVAKTTLNSYNDAAAGPEEPDNVMSVSERIIVSDFYCLSDPSGAFSQGHYVHKGKVLNTGMNLNRARLIG
jgi:hypothetical protein